MALGVDACYATIEVQVKVVGENRLWVSGLVSPVSSPECRFFFFFFFFLFFYYYPPADEGKKIKLKLTTLPRIFIRVVCRFNSVAFHFFPPFLFLFVLRVLVPICFLVSCLL